MVVIFDPKIYTQCIVGVFCFFLLVFYLTRVTTKSRSISTVEGSGATCTRIFLNYFFKTGDLSMVQLTQKMQKISKK